MSRDKTQNWYLAEQGKKIRTNELFIPSPRRVRTDAMYRMGFRQFNANGTVNSAEDVITVTGHNNVKRSELNTTAGNHVTVTMTGNDVTDTMTENDVTVTMTGNDVTDTMTENDVTVSPTEWYTVIQNDDVDEYDRITNGFENKLSLIQGKFIYQADAKLAKLSQELRARCTFETSFILACVFGSRGIVQRMLEDGVDVRVRERNGLNFVHALILAAVESRERESMLVDMFTLIAEQISIPIKRELMNVEDKDGYRPAELAVRLGTYGLFKEIFETDGVYKDSEPVGRLGLHTFLRYDISEYENYESRFRELRSPLRLINYIAEKHLRSYVKFDVHSLPAIKRWREKKIRAAMPLIAIWYIFKLIFVTSVIFLDASRLSFVRARYNKTDAHALSSGNQGLDDSLVITMVAGGILLVSLALVINIRQLLDSDHRQVEKDVPHGFKLVHTNFFTYVQVIMCSLVVVQCIMAYAGANVEAIYGVKAVLIPFGLLSYLQIFLVVPYINRFVIALQRMVVVLIKFVIIHITVRFIFCLFLLNTEHDHPSQNFDTMNDAFYGIFLLDLNIINLSPPFFLQFTHIALFYVSGVLLINYLIAVMTDLAAEVNNYGLIICDITKLRLAYQAQEIFGRFLWRKKGNDPWYLIVKIEDSKSIRSHDKETAKIIDPEKYDIDQ